MLSQQVPTNPAFTLNIIYWWLYTAYPNGCGHKLCYCPVKGQRLLSFTLNPHAVQGFLSFTMNPRAVQGFLAEGLQRTTAGLGSVIIDSQPLTVAVLAALLFGEKLTAASYAGLGLGVLGLSLLEVPVDVLTAFPRKVLG